jgi:hypothetical protein
MRRSTLFRIERLTALVEALSARDLGLADIADLLHCSASASRNYAFELTDAGIIRLAPGPQVGGSGGRRLYRITPDRALVDAFMSVLANPGACDVTRANAGRKPDASPRGAAGGKGRAQEPEFVCNPFPVVVRRDPLVAALFGSSRAGHPRITQHVSNADQLTTFIRMEC